MFGAQPQRQERRKLRPKTERRKNGFISPAFVIRTVIFVILVSFLGILFHTFSVVNDLSLSASRDRLRKVKEVGVGSGLIISKEIPKKKNTNDSAENVGSSGGFTKWKQKAIELARLPARDALEQLKETDTFQVRRFHDSLVEKEQTIGRTLTHDEIVSLFPCPDPDERITLPDFRDEAKANAFRKAEPNSFLFFQHLRKAGGTHFCSMAKANLPPNAVARYFCMPDMEWSGNKNAGYLKNWSNQDIITKMASKGHRIAGNEFQNFDPSRHFDLPATFATSFRKPIDRALSQFRFECIEERGCKIKNPAQWWNIRRDLYNVYSRTFTDESEIGLVKHYQNNAPDDIKFRENMMAKAVDTVSKFNLVLSMEWLSYAGYQVKQILGFQDTSVLNRRVRPHVQFRRRDDGQDQNEGAAGIAKASWVPEDHLSKELLQQIGEDLVLDEILTDVARRMFLERLVCLL